MQENKTLYVAEKTAEQNLRLTAEQKQAVRNITLGVEEVDETIRGMAANNGDIVRTLENGHPLNKVITDEAGKTTGYIACEDFVPHEAYIKYFATTKQTGRSLLRELPAFFEYAKAQGYTKLNFHGWNDRFNHILERYGFKRLRTDNMADFSVDFFQKTLVEEKSPQQVSAEQATAFEQKYINELGQKYIAITENFPPGRKQEKERVVIEAFQALSRRLTAEEGFEFGDRQKAILKLKLARHFQTVDSEDVNVLFDAIVESPKFINTDRGSLFRLKEVHQEKTAQAIAENRKKRAEMGEKGIVNPYENLFQTDSGKYYMARLLNMPHLQEESEYMNHCVGTSDSYVNRIKRGEIEILSFRQTPKVNTRTRKLENDTSVITIEYNPKTKVITQMKKYGDKYISPTDPFFKDMIDALKKLQHTRTDAGELRSFLKIADSELGNIPVKDYYILTENEEVSFKDFNPDTTDFIIKMGSMNITPDTSKEDAVKIVRIVEGIRCTPEEIAYTPKEVTKNTKVYIGKWNPEIHKQLPDNIPHIYEEFPNKKVFLRDIEFNPAIKNADIAEKILLEKGYIKPDWTWVKDIIKKTPFSGEKKTLKLVSFSVGGLGFPDGATTKQIFDRAKELDLELCPAEIGPQIRLQYDDQPMNEYLYIAMEQITASLGNPRVFFVERSVGGSSLNAHHADPDHRWHSDLRFVFVSRK